MRNWKIGVSFNRFTGCERHHGKMAVCDFCVAHMGVYHTIVTAATTHAALAMALLEYPKTKWFKGGYEVVSVDVDPISDELLPRRDAAGTPRSRPAPKATTAKTTSGGRGRGGRGRRTA